MRRQSQLVQLGYTPEQITASLHSEKYDDIYATWHLLARVKDSGSGVSDEAVAASLRQMSLLQRCDTTPSGLGYPTSPQSSGLPPAPVTAPHANASDGW